MNRVLFFRSEIPPGYPARRTIVLPRTDLRARHIRKVLRSGVGDRIAVGVIDGCTGEAVVSAFPSGGVELAVTLSDRPDSGRTDDPLPLTCVVGHPRPIVLRRILRDLATVGARRILVTATELGEKSYLSSTLWRGDTVRDLLVEGVSQAGTTALPRVERYGSVREALERLGPEARTVRVCLDNAAGAVPCASLRLHGDAAVVACGAERGWTDAERNLFRSAGFELCSIGRRVLRTETATVSGTLLVAHHLGLLGG